MTQRWGPYEILEELGRGGMGVVYKGHDHDLCRPVAIKALGEQFANDEILIKRFMREARGAASLNHPHIIQIYFIGDREGRPYFAMEYVEGETLGQLIRREKIIPPRRAAEILLETASGLASAHAAGIIHRDVKPANIMLTREGIVKVADFGIAQVPDHESKLTATGQFLGTPGYLSPEVCMGEPYDNRSDIFSLGVVYFEMLTGRIPFDAESPLAMMQQVVEARLPSASLINEGVDEASRAILARMVQRDRDARYADCEDLIADLRTYLADPNPGPVPSQALDESPPAQDLSQTDAATAADTLYPLTDPLTPSRLDSEPEVAGPMLERRPVPSPWPAVGRWSALVAAVILLTVAGVYWAFDPFDGGIKRDEAKKKEASKTANIASALGRGGSKSSAGGFNLNANGVPLDLTSGDSVINDPSAWADSVINDAAATSNSGDSVINDAATTSNSGDSVINDAATTPNSGDSVINDAPVIENLHADTVINDDLAVESFQADSVINDNISDRQTGSSAKTDLNQPTPDTAIFDYEDPKLWVHAIGDPLMAVHLENSLADMFQGDKRRLLDREAEPALQAFTKTEPFDPNMLYRAARQGGADIVILVQIIELEEQILTVAQTRSTVSVARVKIDAVLAANGRKLNLRCSKDIGYTPRNASDMARGLVKAYRGRIREELASKKLEAFAQRRVTGEKKQSVAIIANGNALLADPLANTLARLLTKKHYIVQDDGLQTEPASQNLKDQLDRAYRDGGDVLIRINARDLSKQEIKANGDYAIVHTARIEIRCFRTRDGSKLESDLAFPLEYTSRNAGELIEEKGKRLIRDLIKRIESGD